MMFVAIWIITSARDMWDISDHTCPMDRDAVSWWRHLISSYIAGPIDSRPHNDCNTSVIGRQYDSNKTLNWLHYNCIPIPLNISGVVGLLTSHKCIRMRPQWYTTVYRLCANILHIWIRNDRITIGNKISGVCDWGVKDWPFIDYRVRVGVVVNTVASLD